MNRNKEEKNTKPWGTPTSEGSGEEEELATDTETKHPVTCMENQDSVVP